MFPALWAVQRQRPLCHSHPTLLLWPEVSVENMCRNGCAWICPDGQYGVLTQLYRHEKMRAKGTNNVLVLLWKEPWPCGLSGRISNTVENQFKQLKLVVDAEQDFSDCFNYHLLLGNAALLQSLGFKWLLGCFFFTCFFPCSAN